MEQNIKMTYEMIKKIDRIVWKIDEMVSMNSISIYN